MHLLLLLELLVDELVFKLFQFFELKKRMVKHPSLQELVTESLVRLAPHGVLVDQGLEDLFDMPLSQEAIASGQLDEKAADFKDLIMKVMWDGVCESWDEILQESKELFLYAFSGLAKESRLNVRKDSDQKL